MLGYSVKDIFAMQDAIELAKKQLNPNLLTSAEIAEGLDMANDLLEGLLAEGRI
jgi:hypothetical protein